MSLGSASASPGVVIQQSRAVLATQGRSFHLAARFLPPGKRDDAAVVYAFCRLVDDVADAPGGHPHAIMQALAELDAEITGGRPPRPVVAALLALAPRTRLDLRWASALIAGCRSDLGPVRISDDRALLRYAFHVAGTVGLMMCAVLDVQDPDALAYGVDLGLAMQLTNICRDVAEDAGRGRVYLPATRLRAHGVDPDALVAGIASRAAVAATVREVLDVAETWYDSALWGLRFIPGRGRLAIGIARRVYRAIGRELHQRGGDALAGRTVVSPLRKGVEVALAGVEYWAPRRPTAAVRHDTSLHAPLGADLLALLPCPLRTDIGLQAPA